jgi:TM2 domain-containing membrane protein YozV
MESHEHYVINGILVGLILPGISQILAQRAPEGVVWLFATIATWWHVGAWALVVHLLSSWRTAQLINHAYDQVLKGKSVGRTSAQTRMQGR